MSQYLCTRFFDHQNPVHDFLDKFTLQLGFPKKNITLTSSFTMRVFVTGASGFVGRAVVQELIQNGHTVLGLVRSDASAEAVTKAGGEPHRGSLEDVESLKSGARACDGVIHLAFIHDGTSSPQHSAVDRAAIEAMADVMAGTGNPLVIAGGTLTTPKGVLATEDTEPDRNTPIDRRRSAVLLHTLSKEKGIRGSVVRLTPSVHGPEDKGVLPRLIGLARKNGFVTYVGDGSARWPGGHRLDAAALFRLALEKGKAGANYNAVAEEAIPFKDIAAVIGKHLNVPAESKTMGEAMGLIGFFAQMVNADNPTSSEKTQRELGWKPTQLGLLEDLEESYLKGEATAK